MADGLDLVDNALVDNALVDNPSRPQDRRRNLAS